MTTVRYRSAVPGSSRYGRESDKVTDVMRTRVVEVGMDDAVSHVWTLMRRYGTRYAVVRQGKKITGVISNRTRYFWRRNARVRDLMRPGMVCVRPDAEIWTVKALMRRIHYDALPVIDAWGRLIGLVCIEDLYRWTAPQKGIM